MKVGDLVKIRNPKPIVVERLPYMGTVGVVVKWDYRNPVVWWALLNEERIMIKDRLEVVK